MVVRMEVKNKILIYGTIIAIILIISIYSFVLVYLDHQDKRYLVMEKKVTEAALKCYNENSCSNETIKLQELYDKSYLSNIVNPKNKEYLNPESIIIIHKDNNTAELQIA